MKEKKFKRSTIFIKRSLQLKYICLVFVSVFIAVLVVGGDVYYTMAKEILLDNPALAPLLAKVNHMIMVKMIIYFGIVLIFTAVVSHRIAGPIYRLEQSTRTVATGNLTHRMFLRGGDELTEVKDLFNEMVSSLQSKVRKDRVLAQNIAERLDSILNESPSKRAAEEASKLKQELKNLTAEFKV